MWDFLIRIFGESPNAILVLAGGTIAIASVIISGRMGAQKELQNGKRAGGPVAIKAALDRVADTNERVIESNERKAEAFNRVASKIDDLGGIIAASNRLATESNKDFAENLNLTRQSNQLVNGVPDLLRNMAAEQRQTTAAINTLATVLSKR